MLFSLLVTLREGIEIALILTILLGYLRNINQKHHFHQIWIGVGAAAALSIGFGVVLEVMSQELSGRALEAFEGFTMLFAVAVLTWMVFWMKRQSAGISRELRQQIDVALGGGSVLALSLLAFSAVVREGIETVLFLFAGSTNTASGLEFWGGGALGFVIAGVAGVVLYYGAAKLPMKQFFLVSGIAVIVLAAGLLSNGLTELYHAGIIADLGSRPWDTESALPMTSTLGKFLHTILGYDSAPAIGQIAAFWGYTLLALGGYVLWPAAKPPREANSQLPQQEVDLAQDNFIRNA